MSRWDQGHLVWFVSWGQSFDKEVAYCAIAIDSVLVFTYRLMMLYTGLRLLTAYYRNWQE